MPDQLYAYHPVTGKLHSASPDYPDYDFERAMLRQGYRIERVTEQVVRERYLTRQRQRLQPVPKSEVPDLPAVGEWIIHPRHGRAQVTYMLTMPEGERVPVCVGRGGSGMVKPGQWEPAAESLPSDDVRPAPASPVLALPPLQVGTPSGQAYYQPSLF